MPEPARRVVVNTTPIISLSSIDRLDLLRELYESVIVPEAVRAEVLAGGRARIGVSAFDEHPWIRVLPLRDPGRADLLSDLDRGEAEVIALAQELKADLVVIDERLARRHARRLGLTMTGTVGVLVKAKLTGLIPRLAPLLDGIQQAGVH